MKKLFDDSTRQYIVETKNTIQVLQAKLTGAIECWCRREGLLGPIQLLPDDSGVELVEKPDGDGSGSD